MPDNNSNLKFWFFADTSKFKKGVDDGKKAVIDFRDKAGDAIEDFANQFGISFGPLRNVLNSFNTSTKGVSAGMKAAASGTTVFSKAMQVLKVALISTGIGALVVALGSLIAYFTKTERGAEKMQRVMAGIKAVFNVLIDRVALFGEGLFKIFTGDFKGGWDTLKDSVSGVGTEILLEAKAATDLERRLQELEDREISLIEIQSEREKRIAEARRMATDETVSAQKKMAAIKEAFELEKQTLNENKSMQRERVAIMQEQYNMSEKTDDKLRELNEAKAELNKLDTESSMHQKTLQKDLLRVTNEIEAQNEEIRKQQEEIRNANNDDFAGFKTLDTIKLAGLDTSKLSLETEKIAGTLKNALLPAQDVLIEFGNLFNDTFSGFAESMAEGLGSLIAGEKGFTGFGSIILGSLAEFAGKAGKIIMQAGLAFFAIGTALRKAIATPAAALAAVAAGAALILVSKVAQAKLNASASGGSAGNISGNAGVYDTRSYAAASTVGATTTGQTINVNVTGTFRQRGSDMVAVINEQNKRAGYRSK